MMNSQNTSKIELRDLLKEFQNETELEAKALLGYWTEFGADPLGGFYGRVNQDNSPVLNEEKGSVLNARILWTFSAAYIKSGDLNYLKIAQRAYDYIIHHFVDPVYGGVFWTVDSNGGNAQTKKQIYALSFCIYGFSEFYKASKEIKSLEMAKELFTIIEKYAHDDQYLGYFEAFTRDWRQLQDQRLSEKDQNDCKSMNTHLHIVEAYANLYEIWEYPLLKHRIEEILQLFLNKIIHPQTHHLQLFFDKWWKANSNLVSYGHDVEASWLLHECALKIKNQAIVNHCISVCEQLADASIEGLDLKGGMFYEKDNEVILDKHWWPQAEAMVGYLYNYQLSRKGHYLKETLCMWDFIKNHIKDQNGEWKWGVDGQNKPIAPFYKIGLWKCPYHNVRACFEVSKLISNAIQ